MTDPKQMATPFSDKVLEEQIAAALPQINAQTKDMRGVSIDCPESRLLAHAIVALAGDNSPDHANDPRIYVRDQNTVGMTITRGQSTDVNTILDFLNKETQGQAKVGDMKVGDFDVTFPKSALPKLLQDVNQGLQTMEQQNPDQVKAIKAIQIPSAAPPLAQSQAVTPQMADGAQAGSDATKGRVIVATIDDFKREVLDAGKPVLLNLHASWCEVCKQNDPELARFAKDYPSVKVVTMDVDKLTEAYDAMSSAEQAKSPIHDFMNQAYGSAIPLTTLYDTKGAQQLGIIGAKDSSQWADWTAMQIGEGSLNSQDKQPVAQNNGLAPAGTQGTQSLQGMVR